ncbi:MAG: hypothetical protein JWQ88_2846 [Rhodoferax sp.]|nr:hypothetical protein [Rhodoferax sp.]
MHTQTMQWPARMGLACAMALALLAPDAALADDGPFAAMSQSTEATEASEVQATTISQATLFSQAVAPEQLGALRGGAQATHNDMTLAGTTADNSAYQVSTGSNAITSGSYANMSGIPVVIQNTGANVLIQNAVILNLQMN